MRCLMGGFGLLYFYVLRFEEGRMVGDILFRV